MIDERYVVSLWRNLFGGRAVTAEMLVEAESLVDKLSPESPLRFRFETEIKDIRNLHRQQQDTTASRPSPKPKAKARVRKPAVKSRPEAGLESTADATS